MSNGPRVSVCIPTHDRPDFLKEAIQSVLAGTEQNFEIVVSDDASSEPTRLAVESFRDPRIRYLKFGTGGIAENWSNAVRNARAPYAFKLDDDDKIEPLFLAKCCDFLDKHPAVSVVFTGFTFHRPGQPPVENIDRAYFGDGIVKGETYGRDILLNRAYPTNHKSAGVFRKKCAEVVRYFDMVTVDVMFTIALAATGDIGYIPEPLFQYMCRNPEHEGMGQRPLQMLFKSVRRLFEIPAVQSQHLWMAMHESAVRTVIKGASVRYIANAFFAQGWSAGWEMVRFILKTEPGLKRSPFFWASALFFSIFPGRLYRKLLDAYIESPCMKRVASRLMRA